MQHGMRDGGWLTFAVDRKEAEKGRFCSSRG
jgi:hypothetical protein